MSVNVRTWDLAVFDGESVVGDRTVGVEVESHSDANVEALEAALAAQPHVIVVASATERYSHTGMPSTRTRWRSCRCARTL